MTETYPVEWLTLRETADHAARAPEVLTAAREWRREDEHEISVDLGCGTGSNMRYLAPRLPSPQHWRLIDHDPALLDAATTNRVLTEDGHAAAMQAQLLNLADLPAGLPEEVDLVTAAALLDLAGAEWLDRLVAYCAMQRAAVLFALTFDGTFQFPGHDSEDDWIRGLVNDDQCKDKGLGTALGPEAGPYMVRRLTARDYSVVTGRSDWRLGPETSALWAALVDGWAAAAGAQQPDAAGRIEAWRQRRRVTEGHSLRVGHLDIFAAPGRS